MASIQIYFEGARFFPHRDGDEASAQRAEAHRAETRGRKGRERGEPVLGEGQQAPSPPARESRECGGAV